MNYKYKIGLICYTSWCGIGFVRGVNSHNFSHFKNETKEPIIYTNSFIYGFFGLFMYANPIFLPISIYKEIYRLEVDIRNLENEKKSRFYNDIL
jgi:hypothetical protein